MDFQELDLTLPKEAIALAESARDFGRTVMRPAGIELDRLDDPAAVIAEDSVLWDVVKGHRRRGFHKLLLPKAFGGLMGKVPPVTGALLSEQFGHADAGLAVVPLDLPGITISSPLDRIGQRPLPKSRIVFSDVKIPASFMIIDDLEKAQPQLKTMLARTNAINAAASVGLAQAAYEEALNYAKQRIQGGVPIFEHKNIRLQLFNMFLKVETARAYNRRVGEYNLTAPSVSGHHSLAAKVLSTRTASEVASDAIAIFGGNGLTREYPVEKMFRDARVAMISDGENNALSIAGAGGLVK